MVYRKRIQSQSVIQYFKSDTHDIVSSTRGSVPLKWSSDNIVVYFERITWQYRGLLHGGSRDNIVVYFVGYHVTILWFTTRGSRDTILVCFDRIMWEYHFVYIERITWQYHCLHREDHVTISLITSRESRDNIVVYFAGITWQYCGLLHRGHVTIL